MSRISVVLIVLVLIDESDISMFRISFVSIVKVGWCDGVI